VDLRSKLRLLGVSDYQLGCCINCLLTCLHCRRAGGVGGEQATQEMGEERGRNSQHSTSARPHEYVTLCDGIQSLQTTFGLRLLWSSVLIVTWIPGTWLNKQQHFTLEVRHLYSAACDDSCLEFLHKICRKRSHFMSWHSNSFDTLFYKFRLLQRTSVLFIGRFLHKNCNVDCSSLLFCHITVHPVTQTTIANESVPIQLAQCRFPGLAISNAKI